MEIVVVAKKYQKRLAQDVRHGVHARKVMESYQTWFGEGPELSVLHMLGLFDRPADEKAVGVISKMITGSLTVTALGAWMYAGRNVGITAFNP